MKLALKVSGRPITDEEVSSVIWRYLRFDGVMIVGVGI
jgi:hypothetical protein